MSTSNSLSAAARIKEFSLCTALTALIDVHFIPDGCRPARRSARKQFELEKKGREGKNKNSQRMCQKENTAESFSIHFRSHKRLGQ